VLVVIGLFKIEKAQRHQYWTFDVGRSMFDVQSFWCTDQLKFHTSGSRVEGLKLEGQRKKVKG
jgi:hypothetical protein